MRKCSWLQKTLVKRIGTASGLHHILEPRATVLYNTWKVCVIAYLINMPYRFLLEQGILHIPRPPGEVALGVLQRQCVVEVSLSPT